MANENNNVPSVDSFEKLPEGTEFDKLPTDLKEQLIEKFSKEATKDENKDSEEVNQDSEDEQAEEVKDEEVVEEEKEVKEPEVKKEPSTEERLAQIEKNYKSLESEFTRRSQKLRDLERENESLKSKVLEDVKREPEKADEVNEILAALKKQVKPESHEFVDGLIKAVTKIAEAKADEKVSKVTEKLTAKDAEENTSKFTKEITEFLESDLKELEPEMDALVAEYYETKDDLLKAAAKNPNLFRELRKELKERHEDKVFEIKSRTKGKSPQERNKEVKDTGVSGKSKTTKKSTDLTDLDEFNKKSTKEKEDHLRSVGAFQD